MRCGARVVLNRSPTQLHAQASRGARGLIQLGFGLGPNDPGFDALRQEFLEIYAGVLTARSN